MQTQCGNGMNIGQSRDDKSTMLFRITELGKERLDNGNGTESEKDVLTFISNQGSCTISDVVKGLHKSREKVEFVMHNLKDMGCINKAN